MRTCRRCGEEKPLSEFYSRGRAGGHKSVCKPCYAEQRKGKNPFAKTVGVHLVQSCKRCGATYTNRYAKKQPFCGRECYWQWKNRHVETPCACCGKPVSRPASTTKRYKRALCSDVCAVKWYGDLTAKRKARERRKLAQAKRRREERRIRERPFREAMERCLERARGRAAYYANPWRTKFGTWRQWTARRPESKRGRPPERPEVGWFAGLTGPVAAEVHK